MIPVLNIMRAPLPMFTSLNMFDCGPLRIVGYFLTTSCRTRILDRLFAEAFVSSSERKG